MVVCTNVIIEDRLVPELKFCNHALERLHEAGVSLELFFLLLREGKFVISGQFKSRRKVLQYDQFQIIYDSVNNFVSTVIVTSAGRVYKAVSKIRDVISQKVKEKLKAHSLISERTTNKDNLDA